MSSHFVALPVGQGDAFYLRRNNHHFLVDGGRSRLTFPGLFIEHTKAPKLDVVVCTHNDADHTNGIIGLLEAQPVPIYEVWLPGTWAWRFKDLATDPHLFFSDLQKDIMKMQEHHNSILTLEDTYNFYIEKREESRWGEDIEDINEPANIREGDTSEWFNSILEKIDEELWDSSIREPYLNLWQSYLLHSPTLYNRLWLECLNATSRILAIVRAAVHAGACIRLFDFVTDVKKVSGGRMGWLEPVNSSEVEPHSSNIEPLFFLALTKANRESLVFSANEQIGNNCPGVLFTGDSDISSGLAHIAKPSSRIIATAPHHGSQSNASAYNQVVSWIEVERLIWVRSDGRNVRRPGSSFKNQQTRACTLCNPPVLPKERVRFHATRSRWQPTQGTRWCSCK